MKWFALSAAVAFLVLAPSAMAGDYHKNATLSCQQCHIMHYSQSHGYNPDGSGFFSNPGAGGPFHFLLRDEVNDLCLACHDNNSIAPDVLGAANLGNEPGSVRQAGYLNRLGIEGLEPTGHTLDTLATAPGSNPPWKAEDENGVGEGLNCINCHHQHGSAGGTNNAYRNLKRDVGQPHHGQRRDRDLQRHDDRHEQPDQGRVRARSGQLRRELHGLQRAGQHAVEDGPVVQRLPHGLPRHPG